MVKSPTEETYPLETDLIRPFSTDTTSHISLILSSHSLSLQCLLIHPSPLSVLISYPNYPSHLSPAHATPASTSPMARGLAPSSSPLPPTVAVVPLLRLANSHLRRLAHHSASPQCTAPLPPPHGLPTSSLHPRQPLPECARHHLDNRWPIRKCSSRFFKILLGSYAIGVGPHMCASRRCHTLSYGGSIAVGVAPRRCRITWHHFTRRRPRYDDGQSKLST
jgi:hypothetical protein